MKAIIKYILVLTCLSLTYTMGCAEDINSALLKAVIKGDTSAVESLIHRGADVNVKDYYGRTALMLAIKNNDRKTSGILTSNNANIYLASNSNCTAFDYALGSGTKKNLQFLTMIHQAYMYTIYYKKYNFLEKTHYSYGYLVLQLIIRSENDKKNGKYATLLSKLNELKKEEINKLESSIKDEERAKQETCVFEFMSAGVLGSGVLGSDQVK